MKTLFYFLLFCFVAFTPPAEAHEYPLQFTPASGYRGLVVAGYQVSAQVVTGNCSYYTVHSGSGRGGGYHTTKTYYNQTCKWELYGRLLSITPGAPTAPPVLYVKGTQTVYAAIGTAEYTGTDARYTYGGFVNTPGSHFDWLTSNAYTVLSQTPDNFTLTLKSDGDKVLIVSALKASALLGKASIHSWTCVGYITSGSTCSIKVTYDPTQLSSATGLAYDTLKVGVISDAGQGNDFTQSYTIILNPVSDPGN